MQTETLHLGIDRPGDVDAPRWHRQCAELSSVLVQSSLSVMAMAITAPDVIRTSGRQLKIFGTSDLSKPRWRADDLPEIRAGPSRLQSKSCARPNAR